MIFEYDSLPKEVKELIPNFKYLLYDLSQFSEEDIKGNVQLTIMLSIFRDVFRKDGQDFLDTIIKATRVMNELEEKETAIQYFETCMRYLLMLS